MNIMINSYCNLRCPYCFADSELNSCNENNMTFEAFETIIDWHKKNNIRDIRIIGGEPTIHPGFIDFLYRIEKDDFFNHIHFFSNMSFSEEIRDVILDIGTRKSISILPNFNDEGISKEKFENIKKNIKILNKVKIIQTIGINIYKPDFDFSYLIDIIKQTAIREIRWAITTPNTTMGCDFDVKKHFKSYHKTLIKFFALCTELGCTNHQDCNSIPMCSFSDKEVAELIRVNPGIFSKRLSCGVVLDVNPKLEVFRCFGMSSYYKTKLTADKSERLLMDIMKIETEKEEKKLLFEECLECSVYKINGNNSCSCILYRAGKKEEKN